MDRSLVSLMIAILLLEIGSGLQGVLLPIRAEIAGYPAEMIWALGTLHYIGFVVGCLRLPTLIRRIGHVRCFSALSAIAACATLIYAFAEYPLLWMGLRVIVGFSFAGLFMVTESWLNDRTTVETRGRVLGVYMLATWVGVISGKLVYSFTPTASLHHFSLVAFAIILSMVPLALTNGAVPVIPASSRMRLADVFALAPIGFVGCFAIGIANSAFWTFGPLFARNEIGAGAPVGYFMAACVIGGAILQWPIGRISDDIDRRWILVVLCLASVVVAAALALVPMVSEIQIYGLGVAFGAASLTLYSICIAHANDQADPSEYVDISSYLLLVFGIGAIAGPLLAGIGVSNFGYSSLFLFTASIEAFLAVFVLTKIATSPAVPKGQQANFVAQPPLSHGTQALTELQPMDETETAEDAEPPQPNGH